jgi:UMF1 family MFS transporter
MTSFKNKSLISWCLYDWANSVLATIIFTFIFPIYFSRNIVGNEELGSTYWGYVIGFSGLFIAIIGPILGSITDTYGPRKVIFGSLTFITIVATLALFWALPDSNFIFYALIFVAIATIGFELAQAQYNAMLPDIAPPKMIGKLSGISWGLGYLGGLFCLAIALIGFIGIGDNNANLFNLSTDQNLNIRATCILAALWYGLFALPLFLWVPDRSKNIYQEPLLKTSFLHLIATLKNLTTTSKNTLWFLIASSIYRDGLNTLFIVGGLYAAGTFHMSFQEILIFAVGLNVASALGSFSLSFFDDKYGSQSIITVSLIALIILGSSIIIIHDKNAFLYTSLLLGFFIGPVQSSSRVLMAHLSPKNQSTEMFGLYTMSGKSIAFTGPLLFAFMTHITNNQRWGIASIIVLWAVGLFLFRKVKI